MLCALEFFYHGLLVGKFSSASTSRFVKITNTSNLSEATGTCRTTHEREKSKISRSFTDVLRDHGVF